jgi:regulator of protease activity HflC (stomatin/prohibitin superfamily)
MDKFLLLAGLGAVLFLSYRALIIVPQGKAAIIEREGRYHKTLGRGLHTIVPFRDKVRTLISVGEESFNFPEEVCQSSDNCHYLIECTVRWMVSNPEKAVFSVTDHQLALTTAARLLLHEEIAKLSSNQLESDPLSAMPPLTAKLRSIALRWGIQLQGVDIAARKTPNSVKL